MLFSLLLLTCATLTVAQTYKASFTQYGSGDSFGSANCNTPSVACGSFDSTGFSAAVSQNLYGVGPGAGKGPACGSCWSLSATSDPSGVHMGGNGTTIVVKVNNLCPMDGNPLCAQQTMGDVNSLGANVNFDTCSDSGASAAMWGSTGKRLLMGTATKVDCSLWVGGGAASRSKSRLARHQRWIGDYS